MNIYEKLAEARKIIRTTNMGKEGRNQFSGYDYYTPEQVEALVSDACEKTKLLCLTNLKKDEFGYFQTLRLIDLGEINEQLKIIDTIDFELRTEKPSIKATNDTQQMGGMDTYSERYIKMKVFQIKDNSIDFDSQDNREGSQEKKKELIEEIRNGKPILVSDYAEYIENDSITAYDANEAKKEFKRLNKKENPNAIHKVKKSTFVARDEY